MHKAYGFDDDAMLWAGTAFFGGIAGHQDGICGAVSGLGIALGFRHRDTSGEKEKEQKAREQAIKKTGEIVRQFKEKFGSINCLELVGLDFSNPEDAKQFFGNPEKQGICAGYVRFAVEKLVELEE